MEDYEQRADELDREAAELAEQGDKVKASVDHAREDLDQKLSSQQVPGIAAPDAAAPGGLGGEEDDGEDDSGEG